MNKGCDMTQKYGMVGEVEAYELPIKEVDGEVSRSYMVTIGGFSATMPAELFEEYFIPTQLPSEDFKKLEDRFYELLEIIENQSESEPAVIIANRYRELANIIEVIGDIPCEDEEEVSNG